MLFDLNIRDMPPTCKVLPPHAPFPRSKPKPDLYRMAIKKRMAHSLKGERILRMEPEPKVAILTTMRELEDIVLAAEYKDDIVMAHVIPRPPSAASRSWQTHTSCGQGMVQYRV
ncbi:hypothetical protein SCLCIDRAFT_34445 [Scleroderma citrinum Foug A]|uniref:Uncharacterized protein n=1 Tax=Scleroderma citrinum Foug A TaxID=1036808 RepID=A0A0C3CNT7_9AGAM|nr:hypothetical protein SCLCIDRAFT_34445 [Scleroderma citrinum Foug A]